MSEDFLKWLLGGLGIGLVGFGKMGWQEFKKRSQQQQDALNKELEFHRKEARRREEYLLFKSEEREKKLEDTLNTTLNQFKDITSSLNKMQGSLFDKMDLVEKEVREIKNNGCNAISKHKEDL